MVLPKSKNAVGLGNSLMNDRFGKNSGSDRKKLSASKAAGSIQRKDADGNTYITNAAEEASWVKMRSVTEQAALEDFLATAELAGTDFTAQKQASVKILHADQNNPYLLSGAEEKGRKKKQGQNRGRLTVPRRPEWDENTTRYELDMRERQSLLEWRRGLAEMQEDDDLLMTPFERNIEVWRQLWRVIERSDLIVQIVDARNPLLFRCDDLESYVREVDPRKKNLLLVNKADMMTEEQRQSWADHFAAKNIDFRFFSAQLAKEQSEEQQNSDSEEHEDSAPARKRRSPEEEDEDSSGSDTSSVTHSPTHILTVPELEALFHSVSPPPPSSKTSSTSSKTTIGLVGYPNVGKSSTINAMLNDKKVSVSATPGKTKHFQTIHLSPTIILCDCPGLVFPNFATSKAELVCAGILPIDQQREFTGPAGLVARRIPRPFLEAVYGISITVRAPEEGGSGIATASELLAPYAKARGFATTGLGQPDESRAARYVLKDYVKGKLLYCHPPPGSAEDGDAFNAALYDYSHLPLKRQIWLRNHTEAEAEGDEAEADADDADGDDVGDLQDGVEGMRVSKAPELGPRSKALDKGFFAPKQASGRGVLKMPFNHKYSEREQAMMGEAGLAGRGKKHFKGNKRKGKGVKVADDG